MLVSWSVAVGIPRFELCLALVGSLTTTVLAFVLPPLFYLRVLGKTLKLPKIIFLSILLGLGVLLTISATAINLYMAVKGGGGSVECSSANATLTSGIKTFTSVCSSDYLDKYDHCYSVID